MKILTIDIDYISGQSFELISYLQNAREMPDHTRNKYYWERILRDSGIIERYLEPDLHNLRFINQRFFHAHRMGCDNVVFGYHHDSILHHIPDEAKDIILVNIDHHHDLSNNVSGEYDAFALGFYAEYNWVLKLENRLKSYTWIKNKNSGRFTGNLPYIYEECHKEDKGIVELIDDVDGWDLVFVCLSPHHTPPKQWHYFWLMKEAYEIISGKPVILETEYYEKDQKVFDTEIEDK